MKLKKFFLINESKIPAKNIPYVPFGRANPGPYETYEVFPGRYNPVDKIETQHPTPEKNKIVIWIINNVINVTNSY